MLIHNAPQSRIKYWFVGIDDVYPFELLAVALLTAKATTLLRPICLHTGLKSEKLQYLDAQSVAHYKVLPDKRIKHSVHYGALLRMYIPAIANKLGIDEIVIYTDSDVIFYNHPPFIKIDSVGGVGYNPWVKPSHNNIVNSGVLYLNCRHMIKSFDAFISFAIDNPKLHNAAAESIYNHFYDISMLPYTLNYFSYWDVPNKRDTYLLHFHGPKPCSDQIVPEISILYNDNYFKNKASWRDLRYKLALTDYKFYA